MMEKYLKVTIRTEAPVILTANRSDLLTATEREISGTILRGVLAHVWRDEHAGQPDMEADFERYFFGGLRFAPARPVAGGRRTFFLPRSLQQSKDKTEYADLLAGYDADPEHKKGFKGKKGLGAVLPGQGGKAPLCIAEPRVQRHIRMHISRSGKGQERLAGRSIEGGVFSYESLDAGQSFIGEVYGPTQELQDFTSSLPQAFTCRIGRSHLTQYGRCQVTAELMDLPPAAIHPTNRLCLRLETPLVTSGLALDAREVLTEYLLQPLQEKCPGSHFILADIHGAQQQLSGFNGAWGMKRPDDCAMAEGTVFVLGQADGRDWNEKELTALRELAYAGIGARVEDGFGQLRFWEPGEFQRSGGHDTETGWSSALADAELGTAGFNGETIRIARLILARRLQEQARLQAWQDAAALNISGAKNLTHFFSRLESLLGTRQRPGEVQQHFCQKVREAGNGSHAKSFTQRLQELSFKRQDGRTFKLVNVLCGVEDEAAEPLYQLADFLPQGQEGEQDKLRHFANRLLPRWQQDAELYGLVYYDYWLYFLRHARKLAAKAQDEQEGGGQDA